MTIGQLDTQPALIDQVHDRLLAAVIDGTLAPGRRVTQDELAQMLGVSRQPVSHAVQVLRHRGLLVDAGKRRLSVAPLDAARIRDLYQVRAALDGLAAGLAADRCRRGLAPQSERDALTDALDAGRRHVDAARGQDLQALVDADVAFHSAIQALSGNAAVVETVAEQWPHFRRSMRCVLTVANVARRVWQEHAAITEAVLAGDRERAAALAQRHAELASEETTRSLDAALTAQHPKDPPSPAIGEAAQKPLAGRRPR